MFGAGLNCKSVVCGFDEENYSDFIGINERSFGQYPVDIEAREQQSGWGAKLFSKSSS